MPNTLLLWLCFAWLIIAAYGDVVQYGMRIKPIIRNVPTPDNCQSCDTPAISKTRTNTPVNRNPANPLVKNQQTASPIYSAFPSHNSSRGTTFFFTQLEPHRFEYRAMFQHHNNEFQPLVHEFQPFSREYPPLPKFPSFPDFQDFFHNTHDSFPKLKDFTFPTLPPEIKRVWNQVPEALPPPKPILPELPQNFDEPLIKNYDLVLGGIEYPKIFKFNDERINIEDFDRQKKIHYYNLAKSGQNNLAETENVKRENLLILHGGIFTVKEPPIFNKHIKKRRKFNPYGRHALHF